MKKRELQIGDQLVKVPILQGGMGVGVSLSSLAGAVSACGGVGVISSAQIGFREPDFETNTLEANLRALKIEIQKARQIARGGMLGVNIMVATKEYASYVKTAVEAGIDLIISGAGLPVDLPALTEKSKTKIAPIVSTVKSASVILRLWERKYHRLPDMVVVEGPEAGGHLGFTEEQLEAFTKERYREEVRSLIRLVKEHGNTHGKDIPVALAGGIYEKKDVEEAWKLGADAVQLGTRFVTTYECDAADAYKETYLHARKEDIELVKSPVGMPGRAIHNAFLEETANHPGIHQKCLHCLEHCNPKTAPYCITRALIAAVKGNVKEGLLFCGSNAWRAEKIEHVSEIMQELME